MALGGGNFSSQNKVLPGTYINFISVASSSQPLSSRGVAAMGLELDWGADNEVFEVTAEAFQKDSLELFGYEYTHSKLKGLRDLFKNIKTLYAYKLNSSGEKATNAFATAAHTGTRGNDLKIIIQKNVDDEDSFDVTLVIDDNRLDLQTVKTAAELNDNGFVVWKKGATLEETAATPLAGGTNGGAVTASAHQNFLDKIESFSFNALGVVSEVAEINSLYSAFCKRMRDELGIKFQTVVFNSPADYEGVVNVKNTVNDSGVSGASLVYWVTGIIAGCEINKSNLNKLYDGEFTVNTDYTQAQLKSAILAGEFLLHQVGLEKRVLSDINSLTSFTGDKGKVFQENQTIRVVDQIANDIATLFNTKYLGAVPNNESGRISLWADIVKHHNSLQDLGAIENFSDSDVSVVAGNEKKAIVINDAITVVNSMAQLYMTCVVA